MEVLGKCQLSCFIRIPDATDDLRSKTALRTRCPDPRNETAIAQLGPVGSQRQF